ncbi:polyprenyl synthetase family protein [Patescibacteria group bacterium]|nr:polyprenyl synthetase family protein [Patescibacteria group bacterium]
MSDAEHDTITLKEESGRFKAAFDTLLERYITEKTTRYSAQFNSASLQALFQHLVAVCSGGKRLRPFMVFRLYRESHPEATLHDIKEVLLAVELFHIFCLIHDDIMDEAPQRHGVATLHQFASNTVYGDAPRQSTVRRAGESHGILIGDLVFNLVMELLGEAQDRNLPHMKEVRRLFHTLVEEVCLGQMLDIDFTVRAEVDENEVLLKNQYKTARYSFVRPLHIGATLAGRPELLPAGEAFGLALGQLYQIQDDILDIVGDSKETKKDTMTDVTQNQHTVLTAYVREHGGTAAELLEQAVGKSLDEEDKAALRAMFTTSGALKHAHNLVAVFEASAYAALEDPALTSRDRTFFSTIATLIHKHST